MQLVKHDQLWQRIKESSKGDRHTWLRAEVVPKLGTNLEEDTSSKDAQMSTLLGLPVGSQMFMSTFNI